MNECDQYRYRRRLCTADDSSTPGGLIEEHTDVYIGSVIDHGRSAQILRGRPVTDVLLESVTLSQYTVI